MILKKLQIRNFKSFGNNINTIEFEQDKGQLILLIGENGAGKTSIGHSLDFVLFNEVRNNNTKLTMASLPNRYNKNLNIELEFESKNSNIKVSRRLNPSGFDLTIDNETYQKAGKSNVQNKLEEYLDFDQASWKSFISMSINDFKNFMVLKPEEKRMLLDKLFNLNLINELSKILKEQKKQQSLKKELFDKEVNSYTESLEEFQKSIDRIKENYSRNINIEKEELKASFNSKKAEYETLSTKLSKIEIKEKEIDSDIEKIKETVITLRIEIKNLETKIDVFNAGTCPTCNSDLTSSDSLDILDELQLSLKKSIELRNELQISYTDNVGRQDKIRKIKADTTETFNNLKRFLTETKNRILELNDDDNNTIDGDVVKNLNESIRNIESRKEVSESSYNEAKQEENIYDEVIKLFTQDGIKKSIITKIVVPLNHYIKENLDILNLPFIITLDDEFNAVISVMGEEIEVATLSTGETRKANIAIMLAYLKLIRMKRHINILFLDEIFSSIDTTSIYDVIKLLKTFAYEYKINMFLIHHAMLEQSMFDKILKIEKNIVSNIIEI